MIALGIFSVGILSLVYLQGLAASNINQSLKFSKAAAFAQGRVETLLALPFNQIANGQERIEITN